MTEPTRPQPHGPRPALLMAALSIALLPAVLIAGPAEAHDDLISTTPGDESRTEQPPTEISMIFTNSLIEVGAVVVVVDAEGDDWADGPVSLAGDLARQPLRPDMPDGTYQARWRVVSSDGHPIAGTFDFAVGPDAPTVMPAVADAPAAAPATAPRGTESEDPTEVTSAEDATSSAASADPTSPSPVIIGALGALFGIGLFLVVAWLRGRVRT